MKRRQFIILTSVGAAGTTLLSACGHPEHKLIPALVPDDEYVPGVDYWKTSTCDMCQAGCGIAVRTREHKANKIEGNPLHPVNRGALCARGQAGLQVLYNPDRIRGPKKRIGERGSGQFAGISWDEAISVVVEKLADIRSRGEASTVGFLTSDRRGVTGLAAELFMTGFGSSLLDVMANPGEISTLTSYHESYGAAGIPVFDIAKARYILSFGARFLETWHSPVMYSQAYSEFRRNAGVPRGKFVQIEPRMSLTAANADEWLPAVPGSEGLVALAIAQVIMRERPSSLTPGLPSEKTRFDDYAPEKTSEQTGIQPDRIIRIAREFAGSGPSLAIGAVAAGPDGVASMRAINLLNQIADSINKPGGVLVSESNILDPFSKWRKPLNPRPAGLGVLLSANASAILVHNANPVFLSPALEGAVKAAPFIASFSTFLDETTALADVILPDSSYLERWDLRTSAFAAGRAVSLLRPVVDLECDTRQTADALIAISASLGSSLPFRSAQELVKQAAQELQPKQNSISAETSDEFWNTLVERGVCLLSSTGAVDGSRPGSPSSLAATLLPKIETIDRSSYPFTLVVYEHQALGFGQHANIPWLQEMPEPMTSAIWGSWVEINPNTAASLGIEDGDLVEVQTDSGAVRVPALLYPAIRPDVIAIPYGQGHTALGTFARGRGANAATLFGNIDDHMSAPARLSKVASFSAGPGGLIRFGTTIPAEPQHRR
jgi:anaerobic selenocysteine-containing dehydrogenase